jgi:hypothetical protein
VLDERLGVLEPLEDDALGLVGVEEDVVLQGSGSFVRTISLASADRRLNSSSLPSWILNRAMP